MLSTDELRAIENWRFIKRMPSRASAIRELLRRGLAAEGFTLAGEYVRSGQFGIVDRRGADASTANDASSKACGRPRESQVAALDQISDKSDP